jgi:hypothetical protein
VSRSSTLRRVAAAALPLVLLAGCVGGEDVQRQPVSREDGLQATGLLDGRRVAISRGEPIVVDGDCDPNDGLDDDLCMLVRTLDGIQLNLVIENPAVLQTGSTLDVRERDCTTCDDVTDVVVLDVRVDGDQRRAEGGSLDVSAGGDRYAAEFDLNLPGGDRLTGSFDVRPGSGE